MLVINDEVCLEYDFEAQRPVVTVHQFFTKVMKAHQVCDYYYYIEKGNVGPGKRWTCPLTLLMY